MTSCGSLKIINIVTSPKPFQKVPIFLEAEGKMAEGLEKSANGDNMVLIDSDAI